MPFDYSLDFKKINFRLQPQLYKIGVGEQGVLLVEPYKSEILAFWRFKDATIAKQSSDTIYKMFLNYLENKDFVGADMARKFLQMGFTRARRYANHPSGKKYQASDKSKNEVKATKDYPYSSGNVNKDNPILPIQQDSLTNEKAIAAEIFKQKWFLAKANSKYKEMAILHKQTYGK